jgi:hypothetical protein
MTRIESLSKLSTNRPQPFQNNDQHFLEIASKEPHQHIIPLMVECGDPFYRRYRYEYIQKLAAPLNGKDLNAIFELF